MSCFWPPRYREPMRIGIIGAGGMGSTHARHYGNVGGLELLIADVDESKAKQLAENSRGARQVTVEEAYATADAIDVCLPTDLHLSFGLWALESGKPLFMEKPFASNLEEAAKLMDAAQKANLPIMVGQVVRFFPEFKRAHQIVIEGNIGRPASVRTRRGGGQPRTDWFKDIARSGGILLDLAVHDYDWLRWTIGEVKSVMARSFAINQSYWPDYALTTLQFDSGAVGHVESTWADPGGGRVTFEVCGSAGMIEHDSRRAVALRTSIIGTAQAVEAPMAPNDDPYFNQMKAFADCVRSGTPPPITATDGFMALSIACAALESARTGRAVTPSRG